MLSKDNMQALKEQLQKAIREVPNFDKLRNHIDMTVTNEGLRIELLESAKGTFFDIGSPELNSDGQRSAGHYAGAGIGQTAEQAGDRRATPIPNRTPATGTTATGNCPRIAPIPRDG